MKVIFGNADGSLEAMAIYGLGEIEYAKDTAKLLALAFTPKLNMAFKRIISYERDKNGRLVSDGSLSIYKKNSVLPLDGTGDDIGGEASTLYAILDRTGLVSGEDTYPCLYYW
jgi:hypothetical protein